VKKLEKIHLYDVRTVLAMVLIVGAVTGGNLWLHRGDPLLGYSRYTGHGFSIDYRHDMRFEELGLGGGSTTESMGMVEGRLEGKGLEQFGVIWMTSETLPPHISTTPEGTLEYVFAVVGMAGTQISNKGEVMVTNIDGHEVAYQTFDVLDSDITVRGKIGAWYCEGARKFLMLFVIHVPDFSQPEVLSMDLESMWQGYLNSLICY
jgi:hypothetical protein